MSLRKKTIVVTGAAVGLGLGLVEALDRSRRQSDCRDAAATWQRSPRLKQGLGVGVIAADITDEAAAQGILAGVHPTSWC